MDQVEVSGRTVDDALNSALRQLGCTIEEVEFTVLDEGRKGFLFGKGARDALVRVVRVAKEGGPAAAPPAEERPRRERGQRRGRGSGEGAPRTEAAESSSGQRGRRGGRQNGQRQGNGGGRRAGYEAAVPELTDADFLRGRGTAPPPTPQREPARPQRSSRPAPSRPSRRRDEEANVEPNIDAEEVDVAATVVDDLLRILDIDADINLREPVTPGDGRGSSLAVIDIAGDDLGVLIGRKGDTLLSMQYLVNLVLNRRYPDSAGVTIDIEHYRHRREEQLTALARRMADRVRQGGNPITLEPMPPAERRLVHLALAEEDDIATNSVGEGDARKVVISLRQS